MINRIFNKLRGSQEAKNAIWLIVGRIFQMILSFFVSVTTARFLGPDNYGLISYASAYIALFTSICTLGINSVIVKDFVDYPNEQGKTIGTTLVLRFLSSLLSAVMIVGFVCIIDHAETITILVTALSSIALVFQIFDTINYWFQSRYESKYVSIVTLIAYVCTSAYKIILLYLQKPVQWFAFSNSLDYIVLAILLLFIYKRRGGPKLTVSIIKAKQLLGKSYHYILSGAMVAIYGQIDKIMLKQMMGENEVGYYSLASTINLMWVFVLSAIIDSVYPTIMQLYNRNKIAFEKKNRQLYAIIIYISVFVGIIFSIFANLIIHFLYGDVYLEAAQPLRILVWFTIFSYLGIARNAWIVCENKQKYLKYMYCSAAIINAFLNYLFIPLWGASGAAIASLVTQICTSMILPTLIPEMRSNVKLMIEAFLLKNIR